MRHLDVMLQLFPEASMGLNTEAGLVPQRASSCGLHQSIIMLIFRAFQPRRKEQDTCTRGATLMHLRSLLLSPVLEVAEGSIVALSSLCYAVEVPAASGDAPAPDACWAPPQHMAGLDASLHVSGNGGL